MGSVLYLADRESPSFDQGRSSVDVVCAGDSITGWNNFGGVECWPYRTYPESLQRLCEPSGLVVANCGIAGEISGNGPGQVEDFLDQFPNARFFILGYGSSDLDKWPEVERTSPMIIGHLDRMVRLVRQAGREAILLDVLHANDSTLPRQEAEDLRRKTADHNDRLERSCRGRWIPLVGIASKLQSEQYADSFHPSDEGARVIAEEVFRVLIGVAGVDP